MNIASFFSGAGGLDLGFENAGFNPVIAYDNNSAAVTTYNLNRGSTIAVQKDLSKLKFAEIKRDLENLSLDSPIRGVIGGPPCQYFSMGNRSPKTNPWDIRRRLPKQFAKLLKEINSEYSIDFFVFENVYGLAKPAHAGDYKKLKALFTDAGFNISEKILDAYDFGVAQRRRRVFVVGFNRDKYPNLEFEFPLGTPSGLTVQNKIAGLKEPQYFIKKADGIEFPEHPNHWTMNPRSAKFSQEKNIRLEPKARSFRRLAWEKPSYTVAYGNNEIHVHPNGHRRLSIYEAMLLQGFPGKPEEYRLYGHLSEQVSLISDAVPPPLSLAVAAKVKEYLV